jgi:hypothetical protein
LRRPAALSTAYLRAFCDPVLKYGVFSPCPRRVSTAQIAALNTSSFAPRQGRRQIARSYAAVAAVHSRAAKAKLRQWSETIRRNWLWLRRKYRAFEQAVPTAFESGMAWVFRKCRHLTPNTALLVILGAVLWFPISFAVATAMHAVLFAKLTSWPAWMQLLHPLATIVAKTKLRFWALGPSSPGTRGPSCPLEAELRRVQVGVEVELLHHSAPSSVLAGRSTARPGHVVGRARAQARQRARGRGRRTWPRRRGGAARSHAARRRRGRAPGTCRTPRPSPYGPVGAKPVPGPAEKGPTLQHERVIATWPQHSADRTVVPHASITFPS